MKTVSCLVLLGALAAAGTAAAQARMSAQEAAQLAAAAGITSRGTVTVNACGRPAQPRFAFVDMNADGRPEAIVADRDPACYGGGTGEQFSILARDPTGRWKLVGVAPGRMKLLETRTAGWRDYTLDGPGCQRTWTYDRGQGEYFSLKGCPGEGGYAPPAAPAAAPTAKPGMTKPAPANASDRAAAFKAAGFSPRGGRYMACDKNQELEIEIRDLNGDGRPDAVVQDFGTECYGSTEQGFVIVTKDAGGSWRQLYGSQGIPTFLPARGAGGWPDIENGGPGFCHPIMRWNGSDYVTTRWRAEQPGGCAGRR